MTLKEKMDALEAIEKLIKHYEEVELPQAIQDDLKYSSEDVVGPDFIGSVREEIDKYKKARKKLIEEIKQDKDVLAYTEGESPKM